MTNRRKMELLTFQIVSDATMTLSEADRIAINSVKANF